MNTTDERKGCTSASSAPYDLLCEGRHQAQQGLTEETSEDAAFGIAIHDALASDDPSKLDGQQLSIYESCVEIREKLIKDTFGLDADKVVRFKEQRYWCVVGKKYEHSGKPDLIARYQERGLALEYKCLPGDVEESPSNMQLRDQVVLASGALVIDTIDVAIIQPLVTHTPAIARYDKATIKRAELEMFERVIKSNTSGAKRTPGEAQCKFCLARHQCAERAAMMEVSVPESVAQFAAVPVKQWTPLQRVIFLERCGMVTKWIDECRSEIKRLLKEDPAAVPGYGLEPGSVKKPVVKPDLLHQRFLESGGSTEQFMACVSIGKKELEAAVRAVTKLKGKALAAKLESLMEGTTVDKPDAPSLVKKS